MSRLLKTSHMEESALLLANEYQYVIAHCVYAVKNPIRMRDEKLEQFHPFLLRAHKEFDSQCEKWKESGGLLLNYRRGGIVDCDALLLAECPTSLADLKFIARPAKHIVTVYTPPSWEQHEDIADTRAPSVESCQRLITAVQAQVNRLSEHDKVVARVLGIPTDGLVVISDEKLAEVTGLHIKTLNHVRDAAIGRKFYRIVMQLIPRIDPEPIELRKMYWHIVNECPSVGNVKIAVNLGKAARFWKSNIKALVRCGAVEKKETLGFYFPDEFNPDYRALEAQHQVAIGQLEKVRELLNKTPELTARNVKKTVSRAHQTVQQ